MYVYVADMQTVDDYRCYGVFTSLTSALSAVGVDPAATDPRITDGGHGDVCWARTWPLGGEQIRKYELDRLEV